MYIILINNFCFGKIFIVTGIFIVSFVDKFMAHSLNKKEILLK